MKNALVVIVIWVLCVIAWCINLYNVISFALYYSTLSEVTALWIVQLIGVFIAPLGCFMGFATPFF